jgi:hypothetical protein
MPTENRRIATYLPKEVDERFKAFKSERGIKGDSHALLTVLSEFLGLTNSVDPSTAFQYEEFSQQLSELRTKLVSLESELFSRLKSELLSEVLKGSVQIASNAVTEVSQPTQPVDLVIQESDELTHFTVKELAFRLGVKRPDSVNRWKPGKDREKLPEKLLEDTRKMDPDGIGWSYLSEIDKFQSEKPLPVQSPSVVQTELPTLPLFDPDQHF